MVDGALKPVRWIWTKAGGGGSGEGHEKTLEVAPRPNRMQESQLRVIEPREDEITEEEERTQETQEA